MVPQSYNIPLLYKPSTNWVLLCSQNSILFYKKNKLRNEKSHRRVVGGESQQDNCPGLSSPIMYSDAWISRIEKTWENLPRLTEIIFLFSKNYGRNLLHYRKREKLQFDGVLDKTFIRLRNTNFFITRSRQFRYKST